MVASYLIYQLTDLLLALAGVRVVARWLDDARAQRWLAWLPWLAATPFRRFVGAVVPAAFLCFALFAWLCAAWLHELVGGACWELFDAPISIRFLGIGAAYYAGLLVLPLMGVARAWRSSTASLGDRLAAVMWLLGSLTLGIELSFLEPNHLVVERHDVVIADWPENAPPLRIAVVSDLQSPLLGARERRVVELVSELAPDLLVFPGDLVAQSLDNELPFASARFVLNGVSARLGTFAVNGDVDLMVGRGLVETVEGTPARLLANESVVLDVGFPLELAGFDPLEPEPFETALHARPRAAVRIAIVHQPVNVDSIGPAGFDLVIAGHTHGGQIVLPWLGAPMTLSPLPNAINRGGLHQRAGTQLYVSRGVGTEAGFAPPMRFRCPPEVTLLTLRSRTSADSNTPGE